nr:MAG TPA: hypothetical protein [Caudoviricetes sp.]
MAKQISALPTAPSTQRPATFNTEADAFVAALPTFVSEANALATEAATNAQKSEDASTTAQSAKESAQTSAQTASSASSTAVSSANEAVSAKEIAVSAATSAKQSEQVVTSVKEGLQDSANALEEIKKIINDGFIDDTQTRTNLTYSSKKIEADFALKNESAGEQKIYGKPLSAAGEASSVVVRDGSGYISSSTPKSEEFTPDHLVCVRGSDGKEKFVPLETIYKNVLERTLKENLPFNAYRDMDIFEKVTPVENITNFKQAKQLKNKNIFLYWANGYLVLTPSFEKVELAYPNGSTSGRIVRLIDESNTIFCFTGEKIYKLIEKTEGCSWEQIPVDGISLDRYALASPTYQAINKFLYIKGGDGYFYKYQGRGWAKSDISSSASCIFLDKSENNTDVLNGIFIKDAYCYGISDTPYKIDLKTLSKTTLLGGNFFRYPEGVVTDYANFILIQRMVNGKTESFMWNTKDSKIFSINPYIHGFYSGELRYYGVLLFGQKGIFAIENEIYFIGTIVLEPNKSQNKTPVIAKINKKMLAYYGIEI